jgi:hypothetical protein
MAITNISLEGLLTPGGVEDRALAHIDVYYNDIVYKWHIYIPQNVTSIGEFLEESKAKIQAQIDAKEAEWDELYPKTREVEGMFGEEPITVPIEKDEIVKPDIPDYYALRRAAYPPIGNQLGAFWKGPDDPDYQAMLAEIEAIKQRYPKS